MLVQIQESKVNTTKQINTNIWKSSLTFETSPPFHTTVQQYAIWETKTGFNV